MLQIGAVRSRISTGMVIGQARVASASRMRGPGRRHGDVEQQAVARDRQREGEERAAFGLGRGQVGGPRRDVAVAPQRQPQPPGIEPSAPVTASRKRPANSAARSGRSAVGSVQSAGAQELGAGTGAVMAPA